MRLILFKFFLVKAEKITLLFNLVLVTHPGWSNRSWVNFGIRTQVNLMNLTGIRSRHYYIFFLLLQLFLSQLLIEGQTGFDIIGWRLAYISNSEFKAAMRDLGYARLYCPGNTTETVGAVNILPVRPYGFSELMTVKVSRIPPDSVITENDSHLISQCDNWHVL